MQICYVFPGPSILFIMSFSWVDWIKAPCRKIQAALLIVGDRHACKKKNMHDDTTGSTNMVLHVVWTCMVCANKELVFIIPRCNLSSFWLHICVDLLLWPARIRLMLLPCCCGQIIVATKRQVGRSTTHRLASESLCRRDSERSSIPSCDCDDAYARCQLMLGEGRAHASTDYRLHPGVFRQYFFSLRNQNSDAGDVWILMSYST